MKPSISCLWSSLLLPCTLFSAPVVITSPTDYTAAISLDYVNPDNPSTHLIGILTNQTVGTHYPGNEGPQYAINQTVQKYLNFGKENTGVVIQPLNTLGKVNAIQFTTANDNDGRDPMTYTLEGTRDGGLTWQSIASGTTGLTTARNTPGPVIQIDNQQAHGAYRVVFPTLRNSASVNSMQVGEISLLTDTTQLGTNFISPYTTITPVGTYSFGGGGSENANNLIDGLTSTKMFDSSVSDGFTYNIDPKLSSVLFGVGLVTANDTQTNGRNPAKITVRGSLDGETWTDIATQLDLPNYYRNFFQYNIAFDNETAYNQYQIHFEGLHLHPNGNPSNGLQLSEIKLFGLVPEPSRVLLILMAMIPVGLVRNRHEKSA